MEPAMEQETKVMGVWTKPVPPPPGMPLIMACSDVLKLGEHIVRIDGTREIQVVILVREATFQEYKDSHPDMHPESFRIVASTAPHFYVVHTD